MSRLHWRVTKQNNSGGVVNKKPNGVHASYFLALKECPKCHETIFAAKGATLAPSAVEFHWRCDLCDHVFQTVEPFEEAAAA
jgi:hypothetical protein